MFRFLLLCRKGHSCNSRSSSAVVLTLAITVIFSFPAVAQESSSPHDKKLDVQSSAGDLHLGTDADAHKIGLPLYPGARVHLDNDKDPNRVNLGLLAESFGVKLLVAHYDSDDAPGKVVDYYRDKLKKYGKVLECHTREHGGDLHSDTDEHDNKDSKELKCEGDNTGPVTELKVGTEDHQHMVAIEPHDKGTGSTFALVYLYVRGKRGEI